MVLVSRERAVVVAATAVVVIAAQYVLRRLWRRSGRESSVSTVEIRPPFPPEIIELLTSSVLCAARVHRRARARSRSWRDGTAP